MNCPRCGSELVGDPSCCGECGEPITPLPHEAASATISGAATAAASPGPRQAPRPLPPTAPPPPEGTLSGHETSVPPAGTAIARALGRGEAFANRYRILRRIGGGGMGEVYLAEDEWERAPVCLKVIRPALVADPDLARRFLREGTLTRRMSHPNIVNLFDVSRFEDTYYITMEHLAGRTLRAWLREQLAARRDVRLSTAGGITLQILAALGEAHAQGIVHRDLKPENVMLVEEASGGGIRLKILDFGIARCLEAEGALTMTGAVLGTRVYMAPEQETGGEDVGPAADLYSAGVILYEMLVEVPPSGRWDLPSEIREDLPASIDAVCRQALNPHPRRRFADAEAFAEALRRVLEGDHGVGRRRARFEAPPQQPPTTPPPDLPFPGQTEESFRRLLAESDWSAHPDGRNETGRLRAIHEPSGLVFVLVPGGIFRMGSNQGVPCELPVHEVAVRPFLISATTTTCDAWSRIMRTPSPDRFGAEFPAARMDFDEARIWCKRAGGGLRLPSEAEWEYACRAGTATEYSFGDDEASLDRHAWFAWNSGDRARRVGSKDPNRWGLFDMHGNVWEWCEDLWHDSYRGAPTDGSAWIADEDVFGRVFRGGSWTGEPTTCRSAYRGWARPEYEGGYLGFRPAASLP